MAQQRSLFDAPTATTTTTTTTPATERARADHDPLWWTEQHTSAWERVRDAFRRDWEQTKADLANKGRELEQSFVDTVKQAVGSEPVPPLDVKTHPTDPAKLDDAIERAAKRAEKAQEHAAKTLSSANENVAKEQQKLNEAIAKAQRDLETKQQRIVGHIGDAQDEALDDILDLEDDRRALRNEVAERSPDPSLALREKMANTSIEMDHVRDELAEKVQRARASLADEERDASRAIASAREKTAAAIDAQRERVAKALEERDEALDAWRQAEREARFGFGARSQFAEGTAWDERVERSLRSDWESLETGRTWDQARDGVRRGWNIPLNVR